MGKTRLAQRVADQGRRAFAEGLWFVDLTAVRDPGLLTQHLDDPDLLAHLVALDVGLRQQSTQPPLELLTDYIGARSVLLVLDNCEHLIPACAVLAEELLVAGPALRILATSREPLGIAGEVLFAVPPLPVPDSGQGGSELLEYESVTLFVARGHTALPGFRLDPDNQAAVAGICRRLGAGGVLAPGAGAPIALSRSPLRPEAPTDAPGVPGLVVRAVQQAPASALGADVGVRGWRRARRDRGRLHR